MSFGAAFGRLIKTRRGIEGLSQRELAIAAFDDESRKTRISELENGRIPNPQQKTVDALVTALAIPQHEIDALRAPVPEVPEGFASEIGLTEGLMRALAWDFGHQNPRAGLAEYQQFLRDKAADYHRVNGELAALRAAYPQLDNQIAQAEGLLQSGDLDEAAAILDSIKDLSRERTLDAVRELARITVLEGGLALLNNDADTVYRRFRTAADLFTPLEPLEGAEVRYKQANELRDHGLRYGGNGLLHAIALAEQNLNVWYNVEHAGRWFDIQIWLAIALQEQGGRTAGPEGAALLARAVAAYEVGLIVRPAEADPLGWAATQSNLGNALAVQGSRTAAPEGVALLARAVAAYEAALTVRTAEAHPLDWAMTQNNLGNALRQQGSRTAGPEGTALLARAVAAYEAALTVCTAEAHPVNWATTQNNLGLARAAMAALEQGAARRGRLHQALGHFDAALTVFDPETMSYNHAKCSDNRARVAALLEGAGE